MKKLLYLVLSLSLLLTGCSHIEIEELCREIITELENIYLEELIQETSQQETIEYTQLTSEDIPEYSGQLYIPINDNNPQFSSEELTTEAYEYYSPLDELGRCGMALASIGKEIMPTEKRGDIGYIKPSGWQSIRYDFVESNSLYNRSHLIGFQLAGENDNERNLITGTRTMNAKSMLLFENMIADYVKETLNHVAYRVTPIFEGNNLVAKGVHMEGYSIEDQGEAICFNVFCYNVEPGVTIDYATGQSYIDEELEVHYYIINLKNNKIHRSYCEHVENISEANRKRVKNSIKNLIEQGYHKCGGCFAH